MDNPHFAKRYRELKLKLHIHFSEVGGNAKQFCAVMYGTERCHPLDLAGREELAGQGLNGEVGHDPGQVRGVVGWDEEPVLVYLIDRIEEAQQLVPAFIRFDFLEDVHRSLSPALYCSRKFGVQFIGTGVDRKILARSHPVGAWMVGLSPEQVEGGPQVVDSISGHRAPSQRRLHRDAGEYNQLPRLRIVLSDDRISVALKKGGDLGVEIDDVLFGPFDLDPAAGGPIDGGHG